jgi:protein-disulfide isomerase
VKVRLPRELADVFIRRGPTCRTIVVRLYRSTLDETMNPLHTIRFVRNALALSLVFAGLPACETKDKAEPESLRIDAKRYAVPLFDDDRTLGGDHALVTVVLYSDYACPPCGTTWALFKNLHEDYGDDVQFVYRMFTVPGHGQGERAADAGLAAAAQGKFWEMHWRLFKYAPAFDRPTLRAHAEAVGLDVPRFLDDLDGGTQAGVRIRHRRAAVSLGIRGLPVMFVNGLYMVGGQTDEAAWHGLLDAEIQRSKEMISAGVTRDNVYNEIVGKASTGKLPGLTGDEALRKELDKAQAGTQVDRNGPRAVIGGRYEVRPGPMPGRGSEDPTVVVVEFLDFSCPFCRKAWEQGIKAVLEEHGADVQFTVRHFPLEIHSAAHGIAVASVAAANQGKFWEFHDRLITGKGSVGRNVFESIAEELGMDVLRFRKDLDDPATKKVVDDDIALARSIGVASTPSFFVNGVHVRGVGTLYGAVTDELKLAEAELKKGVPRDMVVESLLGQANPIGDSSNP